MILFFIKPNFSCFFNSEIDIQRVTIEIKRIKYHVLLSLSPSAEQSLIGGEIRDCDRG